MNADRLFPFILAATLSTTAPAATITVVGSSDVQNVEYSSIVIDRNGNITVVLNSQTRLRLPRQSEPIQSQDSRDSLNVPFRRPW